MVISEDPWRSRTPIAERLAVEMFGAISHKLFADNSEKDGIRTQFIDSTT